MTKARPRKRVQPTPSDLKRPSRRTRLRTHPQRRSLNTPHSTERPAFSGPARWVCLALIAANLIVYGSLKHHRFVNYDDDDYVTANAVVQSGLTWHGVSWAFTTGHAANWHPLTWLSHMLDVELYGLREPRRASPHQPVVSYRQYICAVFGLLLNA